MSDDATEAVSDVVERYDRGAEGYLRYWGPVLEETSKRVLDEVSPAVAPETTLVDIGTGTGFLALEARQRWPYLDIVGADASAGMLEAARARAARVGLADDTQLRWVVAPADRLPLADGSAAACVSSFVLQLVPDRPAALREALRVLRPSGLLAYVTWLDEDSPFAAADEFDEVVYELGIDEPEEPDEPGIAGDLPSPDDAADELTAAGFTDVTARRDWLEYAWDLESYLAYKLRYAEQALMGELDEGQHDEFVRRVRARLEVLPPDAFRWRGPVVFARGSRPRHEG